jgi:hypothetical protein
VLVFFHLPSRRRFRDYAALKKEKKKKKKHHREFRASHQPPVNTFRLAMIENMSGGWGIQVEI